VFHQRQGRHCNNRFSQGSEPENTIRLRHPSGLTVGEPGSALVHELTSVRNNRDGANNPVQGECRIDYGIKLAIQCGVGGIGEPQSFVRLS